MNKFRDARETLNGEQWVLLDQAGQVCRYGQTVTDFRGEKAKLWRGYPPKHQGSTGHVGTSQDGFGPIFYPSVFGLKWERA